MLSGVPSSRSWGRADVPETARTAGQTNASACKQMSISISLRATKENNKHSKAQIHEQIAIAGVKRGPQPWWLVSTSAGWSVWRIDELTERTDFWRNFISLLPSSRYAISRLCPEASRFREDSSTSVI